MRPGRHGNMSSGEFEQILVRNGNFLAVRRAGGGDGYAALYNSLTGKFIGGVGGGMLPEYSRHAKLKYNCACTPGGFCRTGAHGTELVRGWRNLLFEIACRGHVRITNEIVRVLGEEQAIDVTARLMSKAPMHDPAPSWTYTSLNGT